MDGWMDGWMDRSQRIHINIINFKFRCQNIITEVMSYYLHKSYCKTKV